MELAAQHFVVMMDLEAAVGKRISEMLKLPQGYGAIVTSGAASAIQNGYAGILTGNNETFITQIPDLTGMKSEVIIQRAHRSGWDHQIRTTGAKIVEVETVEDVHKAINERTAGMHFQNLSDPDGKINRADWLKLAHAANLPAFLDAAADESRPSTADFSRRARIRLPRIRACWRSRSTREGLSSAASTTRHRSSSPPPRRARRPSLCPSP